MSFTTFVRWCLERKFVLLVVAAVLIGAGAVVAPFGWSLGGLPRHPVPVDAIPNLGDNQQIVFTAWPGRSPQDIEDQVSYPLSVALLGLPGVQDVRSFSILGFSTIYVIFDDSVDFYWSRSRVLEKLASLTAESLPAGVTPRLGPDATALGQVFQYTLEGRDPDGRPVGGWDLHELRSIQDWTVRYALLAADGVAEVASVGGFVQEYQVDVDPDAMRARGVTLDAVVRAIRGSNIDVGAGTIELNRAEYIVRGLGFLASSADVESIGVATSEGTPVFVRDIARVALGPAPRRGALDIDGAEAVGGIVTVRHGANPLEAIAEVREQIDRIAPGLPERVLADGTVSRVTIVPFYDRTQLIEETLGTLESAILQQVLVTVIVVVVMVMHLRSSLLISAMLPFAVLLSFLAMKAVGVEANIVSLSGIAIAVGTIVDVGIVLTENVLKRLDEAEEGTPTLPVVAAACGEVAGAVVTAILTTIVGFIPVFALEAAEGRLFRPLAWTKTFALIAAVVIAIGFIPAAAHAVSGRRVPRPAGTGRRWAARVLNVVVIGTLTLVLAHSWHPLGIGAGAVRNVLMVVLLVGGVLVVLALFRRAYPAMLAWALRNKVAALLPPTAVLLAGLTVWLGFPRVWGWLPERIRETSPVAALAEATPGLGREFMPALDEGSFLYMPSTMSHASIGEALDVLSTLDRAIAAIPEVRSAAGKIGRADTPLDPAPISMVETIVEYLPEYAPGPDGTPVRQWRDHIRTPQDIWDEIVRVAEIPGVTSAPKLQPIETRLLMLQTGFRAPMGIKIYGPDLDTIEAFGLELEQILKGVEAVEPAAVLADRVLGKPYLEIDLDRERLARHGIRLADAQEVVEVAIGGKPLTWTVEGRERYPVRVRYPREHLDGPDRLESILVPAPHGRDIPLGEVARIRYVRGPQMIKSENTFLVSYVLFDRDPAVPEVEAVEAARDAIGAAITRGDLVVPAGVSYRFAGSYENQVRASARLALIVPLALATIFMLLYLQFRSVLVSSMVFAGVFVAWGGGFVLIGLYGWDRFLDLTLLGTNLRDLFQVAPVNLSVAVWVGFLALFGIATDDGVVMATRLRQEFDERKPGTVEEVRACVVTAGRRRIRACLMTTATTILALLPVLTSTGRGADVMVPMAIPILGGMTVELLTLFVVPVLYGLREELGVLYRTRRGGSSVEGPVGS